MYSGLKEKLENLPSITNIETISLSSTSGKWLVITSKPKKEQARHDIDDLINNTTFPLAQNDMDVPIDMILILLSHAAALQKKSTPREQQYNHTPKHAFK